MKPDFMRMVLLATCGVMTCMVTSHAQPIIGGTNASVGEFPWIAGVAEKGETDLSFAQLCGASLIAPNWVLTAAHCVMDDYELPIDSLSTTADIDVFLNVLQLTSPGSAHERISLAEIIPHPDYDPYTSDNDIALLRLSTNSGQPVVSLPEQGADALYVAGTDATVMGWGIVNEAFGISADVLQKLQVDVILQSACNSADSYDGELTSNMFCAGFLDGGKDACQGDSGGPLAVNDHGTWRQIGVVSWGEGCAEPDLPGVYVKVANYIDWMKAETGLPLGIPQLPLTNSMRVYQSGDHIVLELFQPQTLNVRFLDMAGRILWTDRASSDKQFDVSDLVSGPYIFQVQSETEMLSRKFVKW